MNELLMKRVLRCGVLLGMLIVGCGTSQRFTAVPESVDKEKVPHETVEMTAEHFHFTPDVVRVHQGSLVTIRLRSIDGTHGFNLGAFGIDERIEENETKVIEFYAAEKGEFSFKCSHFCGIGHLGMNGKIIVE